jgi:two-component sensor histidine kinase
MSNPTLRPAMVIWGFGYVLVELLATLLERTTPGTSLLSSVPLFVLGVAYTLLLDRFRLSLIQLPGLVRWLALGVALFAVTATHTYTDLYWLKWLSLTVAPGWQEWALNMGKQRVFTVGLLYLWTFCLALTVLWAARISTAAQQSAARASAFEAASHRAEAAALRLQLNPHFLFNTLNSIASLVTLERKQDAEDMIGQLADFLRASLASDPMADVPLGDELATIEAYLGIESARFGERMEVDISCPDSLLPHPVPNFILQPLVENAIKHGVAASRACTLICVTAEQHLDELVLSVINTTTDESGPKPSVQPSDRKGIGIANIRQRLAIGYGKKARLETSALPNGHSAVIRMPFNPG